MTTMIAEVYEAFISVGIKEEKAKAAAIALSSEAKSDFCCNIILKQYFLVKKLRYFCQITTIVIQQIIL